MKLTGWKTMTAASAFAVLLGGTFAACSGDDSTPSNTGGSTNTGGSAGGAGTGGTQGTGGGGTGGSAGTGGTVSDSGGADACTCTGANCTPAGVLFDFNGSDGGAAGGWDFYPPASTDGGLAPVQGTSATEGHTAMGSLSLTVPYTDYGQTAVSIQHNYGSSPSGGALNWSCKTAVHFWVKVAPSADGGSVTGFINGIQGYIQSGDPNPDAAIMGGYTRYTSTFVNGSMFADGMFHEIVVPFGDPAGAMSVNPTDVNQIGVQVLPIAAADAGTGTPTTVTLFIDDISLQ